MTQKLKFVLGWVENVEKGENAGYQHFLFSHNVLKSFLFQRCQESGQSSKHLKAFAEDKINVVQKFKFPLGSEENIVGKDKFLITFSPFSTCFQTPSFHKKVTFNPFPNKPWFIRVCHTSLLKTLWEKEKLLKKRAISPFPTVFSTLSERSRPFSSNLKLSSANSFSLEGSKICRLGKG